MQTRPEGYNVQRGPCVSRAFMVLSHLWLKRARGSNTVWMPHLAEKLHGRRCERVVLGKLELGGEDAALEGGALGPLDQGFPDQEVIFGDGAGGDALGRVVG